MAKQAGPSQVASHLAKLERIIDLLNYCYGCQFQEVYAYEVNGALCFAEHLEAMANQFGIPEHILVDLKQVGDAYTGPTSTGEEITIECIALREATTELEERILPSVCSSIKAFEQELSGTYIQSGEVYVYRVNDELRIVESPEAMAQSLGLPETELADLKDMYEEYHSTDIQGQDIVVKRVALYDAVSQLGEQLLSHMQLIKALAKELYGDDLQEVYAYQVNGQLRLAESPEAMAEQLRLPTESLAHMMVGDKHTSDGIALEDGQHDIQRIPLKHAVENLQAYRDATAHAGSEPMVSSEMENKAKDVESLDMLGQDSDMRLEDKQINQEGLNTQFELFLRNEKGKQIKKILAEVQDLKDKITWEEKSWQESKYSEYMNRFTDYKRKIIYNYGKIDTSNKNYILNDEGIIKNMNNILLAARVFLVEQHYRSFLETPQGQRIAQLESNQANDWKLVEQHCSLEVRRQIKHLTTAKYYFLREELVRTYIDPHVSDEQKRKCIDTLKVHIEETNRLIGEQIKSLSKKY